MQRPRSRLAVERLEARWLPSLVTQSTVTLPPPAGGDAVVLSVQVISDDSLGRSLLQSSSLTVQASETVQGSTVSKVLTPSSSSHADVNGDGIPDLALEFRVSDLQGFVPGQVMLTVQGSSGGNSVQVSSTITVVDGSQQGQQGQQVQQVQQTQVVPQNRQVPAAAQAAAGGHHRHHHHHAHHHGRPR